MRTGTSRAEADDLVLRIGRETDHPVRVLEDGNGFAVLVESRTGTFYFRSAMKWEQTRRLVNRAADAPTTATDPELARETQQAMDIGAKRAAKELAGLGVTRSISFLGDFIEPVVWLVTERDSERDHLMESGEMRDTVLRSLRKAGVREGLVQGAGVTVESQETVDREFAGSWWAAVK